MRRNRTEKRRERRAYWYRGDTDGFKNVCGWHRWPGARIWFRRNKGGAFVGWDPWRGRFVVERVITRTNEPRRWFRGTWWWDEFGRLRGK
jgi:hypothetical protein